MVGFFIELGKAIEVLLQRTLNIIQQPSLNTEMLWILLPLLITLFLIELYFSRYREEDLGWNSAVGNSLVLFFVAVTLLSYLHKNNLLFSVNYLAPDIYRIALTKSIITFLILLESVLLIVLNFFHLLPKNLSFGVSSTLIINFIGAIVVILVYSNLALDIVTLLAVLFLFICAALFFKAIQMLIPTAKEPEETEEKKKEGIKKPVKK